MVPGTGFSLVMVLAESSGFWEPNSVVRVDVVAEDPSMPAPPTKENSAGAPDPSRCRKQGAVHAVAVRGAGLLHTEPEEGGIVSACELRANTAIDHR